MSAKPNKTAEVKTETKVEKKTEAVVTTPAKKQEKKQNLVYLGPTIPGVIRKNDVYQDGILPEAVEKRISALPIMGRLFVSLDDMTEAVKELKKETSALGAIYTEVAKNV